MATYLGSQEVNPRIANYTSGGGGDVPTPTPSDEGKYLKVSGGDLVYSNLPAETDPTISAWAKAATKPSYTAAEVGAIATGAKGAANGVASLGSDGKVPSTQLPAMNYIPSSEKGVANGVASLDANGRVPDSQLPPSQTKAPFIAGSSAPTDTTVFWIDTGNSNMLKFYYNGAWTPVKAAWA